MKNNASAVDYTLAELMAVTVSKQIADKDRVFIGIGVPMLGAVVATKSHAPNAIIAFEGGYIGGKPIGALWAVGDSGAAYKCTCATTMWWVFSDIQRGYYDVAVLGGAQIDKYGNLNTTAITGPDKSYRSPLVRLPGSGGANDAATSAHRTIVMMRLEKQRFLEKVDYITSPGYIDGPNGREKAGLRRGGPVCVITDKCVFKFDENSKEMFLYSVHPGIKIEEIKGQVSWNLKIAPEVTVTEIPTIEEVNIIRSMDPADIILRVKRIYEQVDFFTWANIVEEGWGQLKEKA